MPYIIRNAQGAIMGVTFQPTEDTLEYLPWGHPEVSAFVDKEKENGGVDIAATDFSMARVTEDLIELLISKNVIRLEELPAPAQKKLLARKALRESPAVDFGGIFGSIDPQ